jgi:hypothetical protein
MLAPEGLRLIQESGSLAGRCCGPNISQGIAFLMLLSRPTFDWLLSTNFFNVPCISHTRRSILKGVSLLKEGLVWRVGDEGSIMAWDDPWILAGDNHRPRTRFAAGPSKVADLINPNTGGWDEQLVQNQFHPEDAKASLSISSVMDGGQSCLALWPKRGIFGEISLQAGSPAEGQKAREPGGVLEKKHRGQCCQT